jgi:hypothetical protein
VAGPKKETAPAARDEVGRMKKQAQERLRRGATAAPR